MRANRALRLILGANCCLFIIVRLSFLIFGMTGADPEVIFSFLSLPADLWGLLRQPWSLLTYMFLQVSPLHLIINIVIIYWFAILMARTGDRSFIPKTYILCGLAGGIAYLAAMNLIPFPAGSAGTRLAGASAATLGMAGFSAVATPGLRIPMPFGRHVSLRSVALLLFIVSLISCIGVDYGALAAHSGGFLAGVLIPLACSRRRRPAAAPSESEEVPRDHERRLDSLLDKISLSGYSSLSEKEKKDLSLISSYIKKKGI